MRNLLRLLALFSALLPLAAPVAAAPQGPLVADHPVVEPPPRAHATFEAVWRLVNDQHFDPEFNGVDWDAVRYDFEPRVDEVSSVAELRALIGEMLGQLGQSHFVLIPHEALGDGAASSKASPPGTTGFDVRVRPGGVLVTRVDAAGPARDAGVRTGWYLVEVDGTPVDELIAQAAAESRGTLRHESAAWKMLLAKVGAEIGATRAFVFEDGEDQRHALELVAIERDAKRFDLSGLPTMYLEVAAQRLEREQASIGVVRFSNWFQPIQRDIERALKSMRDCDGVVIDLRGNSGGSGLMAQAIASQFFREKTSLGIQRMRTRDQPLTVRKKPKAFEGPLAILTDETTGSCSEVFSGGMQALGRAVVFGERTAGSALPATLTELPNDDYLLHAIADYLTVAGESMEGDGVQPDERVTLDRDSLLAGRDPVLEAAVDWISAQAGS